MFRKTFIYSTFSLAFILLSSNIVNAGSVDLTMENISSNPAFPKVGEITTVTFWGRNVGDIDLTNGQGINNVGYLIRDFTTENGSAIGETTAPTVVNPLKPGNTYSVKFIGSFSSAGNKSIYFKTDNANELPESNENNNTISGTLAVAGSNASVDLAIEDIYTIPAMPVAGQPVKVIVRAKYIGNLVLNDEASMGDVMFSHPDFQLDSDASFHISPMPTIVSPLQSGDIFTYTINGKFISGGNKSFNFEMDNGKIITESNENNNSYTKVINVINLTDLIKLANNPAVYIIGWDGNKHLYSNSVTFWSYYTGPWSSLRRDGTDIAVKIVSQEDFDTIPSGKNITVKPSSKLIKFDNSSKIYTVYGDSKLKLITDQFGNISNVIGMVIIIQSGFEADYTKDNESFIDSDNDGLSDTDEGTVFHTNPNIRDSDGDGYNDGNEAINGYDPNGPGKLE